MPGVRGWSLRTTADEADEVHPEELVTVKVYVPAGIPEIDVVEPDPVTVVPPGDLVTVHVPVAGSPLKGTVPVGTVHVG